MKNFKGIFSVILVAAAFSLKLNAKPIEDGSSFTGLYHIVETTCQFPADPYASAPVDQIRFTGTPEGLNVNGTLIQIQHQDMTIPANVTFNATSSDYVSPSEFKSTAEFRFNQGAKPVILVDDYTLDTYGNLTRVSTNSDPSQVGGGAYSVCHYTRMNP